MGFPIPKIEWKNATVAGDTSSGSAVIQNLTSTSGLAVGMFCKGTGIQSGAKILTVDSATQVTLTLTATATASGVSLDFGFELAFDYPPIENSGEKADAVETVSISRSGVRQVSVSYIEIKRNLEFSFLSQTLKLELDTFMHSHALYGNDFRYFDDKTLTSYVTYSLGGLKYDPKKIAGKGVNSYVWAAALDFRRAA